MVLAHPRVNHDYERKDLIWHATPKGRVMQDSASVIARCNIKKIRSELRSFLWGFCKLFQWKKTVCLDWNSLYMSGLQTVLCCRDYHSQIMESPINNHHSWNGTRFFCSSTVSCVFFCHFYLSLQSCEFLRPCFTTRFTLVRERYLWRSAPFRGGGVAPGWETSKHFFDA